MVLHVADVSKREEKEKEMWVPREHQGWNRAKARRSKLENTEMNSTEGSIQNPKGGSNTGRLSGRKGPIGRLWW
jgi:hypothetical protein